MRASVTGPQPRPDRVIEARRERKRRDLNPRSLLGRSLSRRVQSAALPRFPAARVAGAVQIDPSGVVWWDHATRAGEATMRFDENAQLDTSNIDDLRGSGGGGGGGLGGRVAVGGGGLGIIGLILYFLLSALGGGGSFDGGGALPSPSGLEAIPQRPDRRHLHRRVGLPHRRAGEPAARLRGRRRRQLPRQLLDRHVRPLRPALQPAAHRVLQRRRQHRLRRRHLRHRAVLLPGRQPRLHRPVLLQGAGAPLRCAGRQPLPRLRDRARVRPPRAGPARHHQPRAGGRHRPHLRLRAPRAAGRLLRGRVDQPRHQRAHVVGPAADQDITQQDIASVLDTASRIGDDFIQSNLGSGRVDSSQFTHGSSAAAREVVHTGYRPATRRSATRSPAASTSADPAEQGAALLGVPRHLQRPVRRTNGSPA